MSFSIRPTPEFQRRFKALAKKYPSLPSDLAELAKQLAHTPILGIPLGHSCYKIRLAIASKGQGKSGGSRVITYVLLQDKQVLLLTIYDKSVKENLAPGELDALLSDLA